MRPLNKSDQNDSAHAQRWFPRLGGHGEARLRLFCFPFAGGSAATFAHWPQSILPGVEVHALQLPGRGYRINETPRGRVDQLIPDMLNAIHSYCDLPMVFFGHSNGALLAYELASQLPVPGQQALQHLVLSAKPAPHVSSQSRWHLMADDELTEELKTLGGTPPELLAHEEFMRLMLPMVRADFALSATYQHQADRAPLKVAASLWWGEADSLARMAKVCAWQSYFADAVQTHAFSGGHFFINEQRELVLEQINELVRAYVK